MCGRFTQRYTWQEVRDFLDLGGTPRNLEPRYNVAPTDPVDVLMHGKDGARVFQPVRWGLIPAWWKKTLKEVPATFNARAEGIETKPMFRDAFRARRCIIPASGFYEWEKTADGKQPYHITAADGAPVLAIAGLWDRWKQPDGEWLLSATMVVTSANEFMGRIHDRMPVFLCGSDAREAWLSGEAGNEVLRPASEDFLMMTPVSKEVNAVRHQGPHLLEPSGPPIHAGA